MSKVIQKTILIQTQEYLDKNGLPYSYQAGFRANFSTDSCLIRLTNFILREMDKDFHIEIILVDLQTAFDTLDHTGFLQKMECIGFKESVIKWLKSYLSNTKLFLTLEDARICIFRCWTNKLWCFSRIYLRATPFSNIYKCLPQSLNETASYLYADDTCIFYQDQMLKK